MLLCRAFAYISVYRFLVGKTLSLPPSAPIIFVTMTEFFHIPYIAMMFIGYNIEAEQGETLEILRSLIGKNTETDLLDRINCLADTMASSPIQCSCGFLVLNLEIFLSVSNFNCCSNTPNF
jgi:hypothetical protein